jgi:hypothetical protein
MCRGAIDPKLSCGFVVTYCVSPDTYWDSGRAIRVLKTSLG